MQKTIRDKAFAVKYRGSDFGNGGIGLNTRELYSDCSFENLDILTDGSRIILDSCQLLDTKCKKIIDPMDCSGNIFKVDEKDDIIIVNCLFFNVNIKGTVYRINTTCTTSPKNKLHKLRVSKNRFGRRRKPRVGEYVTDGKGNFGRMHKIGVLYDNGGSLKLSKVGSLKIITKEDYDARAWGVIR